MIPHQEGEQRQQVSSNGSAIALADFVLVTVTLGHWNAAMMSMTGFGRAENQRSPWTCRIEVASVNRRQLDVVVHVPRTLLAFELPMRKFINERVVRGRVSIKVALESEEAGQSGRLRVSRDLARDYLQQHAALAREFGESLAPLDLTRANGVFEVEEVEPEVDELWPLVEETAGQALEGMLNMRREEGAHLAHVIGQGRERMLDITRSMKERAPIVVTNHRASLAKRLEEAGLPLPLDDERLVKEIGFFAERCDISEELDRLDSHAEQLLRYLESDEPVGRSLDFLAQELNREFNTIGSKANDAVLTQLVVAGKTEIEKIREQVQNIE